MILYINVEKITILQYKIKFIKRIYRLYKIINFNWIKKNQSSQCLLIFGAQRSGTDMLINFFHNMPFSITYNQYHKKLFINGRIRTDLASYDKLTKKYPLFVIKSVSDSQNVIELLHLVKGKAIWIYRDYYDTSVSAKNKWIDAQRHIIRNIVKGYPNINKWYSDGINQADFKIIKQLYKNDISEVEAGILKWYLRNKLFFNQNLHLNPKVLLVKYEDLVMKPEQNFPQITKFFCFECKPYYHSHVHNNSVNKKRHHRINSKIEKLAKGLLYKLDTYKHTLS